MMNNTGKMMKKMNIDKHMALSQSVIDLAKKLQIAEDNLNAVNTELRATVTVNKVGDTFTMTSSDGYSIKCVRNRHNRFDVKRDGKMLFRDTLLSINELRLSVALGSI
jgi:hypothetical protein